MGWRQILTALCATLSTGAYAFTWNSVSVALPQMQGAFSATTDQITWVMIAFVIGSAIMTACIGWFSGHFGRKQLFLFAIAGYTLTLLGCGFATTLYEEIAWRFFQGIAGASLIPLGQAIAVNAFPRERYSQATSLWALGFVTANVISPVIAGRLIEGQGWQWVFFVTVPLGIVLFVSAWFLVPKTPKAPRPLDWTGFTSLIIGVGVLQLMLARGERLDWFDSTEIVFEAVVAGLALYIFAAHTMTAKAPFIDRGLFADRDFTLGLFFIFLVGSVMFLPLLLLPLLLQQIGGYPPIATGDLMLARGFGSILSLLIISRIRDKIDPRPLLLFGLCCMALPAWLMSRWTVDIRTQDVILANFLQGLASGAIWAPLNVLTLSKLQKRVQDQGYALFYLSFDVGSAIGTAVIIGLHTRYSQINHALLNENINPFNELLRGSANIDRWGLSEPGGLAAIQQEIARQATMIAYNNSFLAIALIMLVLIPFLLLFRRRDRGARRD